MENQSTKAAPGGMKNEWLFWIILLIPFLYIPFIWDKLPDTIPTHWNIHGEPDKYSAKTFGTLFLPLLNIVMYAMLLVIPKIDPRKRNYQYFNNTYRNIRLVLSFFMLIIFLMTIQWSLGNRMMGSKTIIILVLVLLAAFGNYMKTFRSNFFIGIRTPWTLDNPEVWRRTHERSGKLYFYTSLAAIVIVFFLSAEKMTWFLIPYLSVIIIYPILYSYLLFRKIGNAKAQE